MNFTGSVAPVAGPIPAPAPHAERDGPDRAESQTPEVTQGMRVNYIVQLLNSPLGFQGGGTDTCMPEFGETMTSAQDNRYAAIQRVVNQFLDENAEWSHATTRVKIGKAIYDLRDKGRTAEWKLSIQRWREMVEDKENDTRWALLQGSVMAGHNA